MLRQRPNLAPGGVLWQKFSEILRILAEILIKKMAGGASDPPAGRNAFFFLYLDDKVTMERSITGTAASAPA